MLQPFAALLDIVWDGKIAQKQVRRAGLSGPEVVSISEDSDIGAAVDTEMAPSAA